MIVLTSSLTQGLEGERRIQGMITQRHVHSPWFLRASLTHWDKCAQCLSRWALISLRHWSHSAGKRYHVIVTIISITTASTTTILLLNQFSFTEHTSVNQVIC